MALLSVLSFLLLLGCAKAPTQAEMEAAYYGSYPEDYEQIIKNKMVEFLLDPYSAQYHFQGQPTKRWMAKPFGGQTEYGWGGIVLVNAKNRMGGYVGARPFAYVIRDGVLVVFTEQFR